MIGGQNLKEVKMALLIAVLIIVLGVTGCAQMAPRGGVGSAPEAKDMALVGFNDLQNRSAYQPVIHHQGDRFIAYVGHHGGTALNPLTGRVEPNGTSVVDVTDPRNPKYLAHIPGSAAGTGEAGGAQMVRVCDGKDLPKGDPTKTYLLRTFGNQGHEILDVSDPAKPVYIRDFGLVGQEPGSKSEPVPQALHGPIRLGNRVYFGYGSSSAGTLQIVDREKLLNGNPTSKDRFAPTPENLRYPEISRLELYPNTGAHTTFPVLGMTMPEFAKMEKGKSADFVVIVTESTQNECREFRHPVFFVDITDEKRPFSVSNFDVIEASGDFCERGGRFGAHASNESFTPIYYQRMIFVTYFNAGVRAVDIRDPYRPKEVGYYIPAITEKTDKRCVTQPGGGESCKIAIQSNNPEVDDRGYIYVVDRANTGMHILELTGAARTIANFP